jgi:hypothetical protein
MGIILEKHELNDLFVANLEFCKGRPYKINDSIVPGFSIVVGRRTRTYVATGEYWKNGFREISTRVTLGHHPDLTAREARRMAREMLGMIARGERPPTMRAAAAEGAASRAMQRSASQPCESLIVAGAPVLDASAASETRVAAGPSLPPEPSRAEQLSSTEDRDAERRASALQLTLRMAWDRYRVSHLERKKRSPSTISGYRMHLDRYMADWLDRPIVELADDPDIVARRHDALTAEHGAFAANGCMRTLRAIYNHAWKKNKRFLPQDSPTDAVDWNPEPRRNTAMGSTGLSSWFEQLARIDNLVRREFHLFLLLSGSRPGATKQVRRDHLDLRRRVLHIAKPKGGEERAFDIPLSREMICCLARVIRLGRILHPEHCDEWLFPASSASGHLEEHQEDRRVLSKFGNDLRQSYRTIGVAAGVSEFDAKLLMNHSIPGVNAGYITRGALIDEYLRKRQQAISTLIFHSIRKHLLLPGPLRSWLAPQAARAAYRDALEAQRAADGVDDGWLRLVA